MPAGPSSSVGAERAVVGSRRRARSYAALRRGPDVGRVRRTGARRRVAGVTVIVAPGVDGPPRVAFVAGRSLGSAVRRNRAKRRLREAMDRLELEPGHDYVVLASKFAIDAPFEGLVELLRRAVEGS